MSAKPTSVSAAVSAAGSSGGGGGGSFLRWVKGHLAWLAYQGVGVIVGLPLVLKLFTQLVTNPRKTLQRKDRNQIKFPDPLPGLTHEWIETAPDVRLHAVRTSKGSGKPLLLFVHGFPEFWYSWRHQLEAFRKDYEAVAIDLRGYGESSKPKGRDAYRMNCLAGDINAVAEHLLKESGQKQLVLAGHDWGGNVCWAAAYLAPHLYRKLAILAVPHPKCYMANMDWDQFRRSWQVYVFAFQVPFIPEAAFCANDFQQIADAFLVPPFGPANAERFFSAEDIERYKQNFGRPGMAHAAINYYRAMIDANTRKPVHELRRALKGKLLVPTLVLWGEKDGALGTQLLRGTEKYVDSVKIVILPGCSHWIQHERPEETNSLLREFLEAN
ncbi:hypothetical protein ABPG77_009603 [Micractinium sp. CCAP 211/92]